MMSAAALAGLTIPASAPAQDDRREEVVRSAPGQYPSLLDAIDERRAWRLDLSLFTGFDSNPSLTAENEARSKGAGAFFGAAAAGHYRLYDARPWTLSAFGSGFHTYPVEIPDFSVVALRPGIVADYRFRAFDLPMAAAFGYDIDAVWVGGSFFNLGHALTWSARVPVFPHFVAIPSYRLAVIDFKEDPRDAVKHRWGLSLRGPFRPFSFGHPEWSLDYGFVRNNAGDLHAYDGHEVSAGLALGLRPGLLSLLRDGQSTLQAAIGYEHRSYSRYPTSPARRDDTILLSAGYATPLYGRLRGSISIAHRIGDSNLAAFTTRRTTVTFALTWRF